MRQAEPGDRFVDDALRIVDDLLHGHPFTMAAARRATVHRRRRSTPQSTYARRRVGGKSIPEIGDRPPPIPARPFPVGCSAEYRVCYPVGRGPRYSAERKVDMDNLGRHIRIGDGRHGDAGAARLRRGRQRRPGEDQGQRRRLPVGQLRLGPRGLRRRHRRRSCRVRTSTRRSPSASRPTSGKGGTEFVPGIPVDAASISTYIGAQLIGAIIGAVVVLARLQAALRRRARARRSSSRSSRPAPPSAPTPGTSSRRSSARSCSCSS